MLNNYLFQNRLILKNRLLGRFFFLMNLLPFKLTCVSYITLLESHFILFRLLSFPVPSDKALWLFCFVLEPELTGGWLALVWSANQAVLEQVVCCDHLRFQSSCFLGLFVQV